MLRTRFLTLLFTLSPACFAQQDYPLTLENKRERDSFRIIARNDGPAPVSIRASLSDPKHVATTPAFPLFAVVPPHSGPVDLARIKANRPGVTYSFRVEYRWAIGDFTATPTPNAGYRLPFEDGLSFRIGQAPGGPITTHRTAENLHAVDIPMPEGTPLVATRDGVVIYTQTEQVYGAQNPDLLSRANEVRILHKDGAITTYAHLAPGGVLVKPGERVNAGTRIGYSGSTGFSSGPHLHFAVHKLEKKADGFAVVSLPFRFEVGRPPVAFAPQYGMTVKADYRSPGTLPKSGAAKDYWNVSFGAAEALEMDGAGERIRSFISERFVTLLLAAGVFGTLSIGAALLRRKLAERRSRPSARQRRRGEGTGLPNPNG